MVEVVVYLYWRVGFVCGLCLCWCGLGWCWVG